MTKENPQLQSKSQPELGWNLKKKKEMTGNLQPEASAMLISAFYSTLDSTWKKKRNLVLIITQSHRACPPPPPLPPISFLFFSLPLALPNVLSRSFAPLLKYEHVGLIRGYGKKHVLFGQVIVEILQSRDSGWDAGYIVSLNTPIYKLYRYVPPQSVWQCTAYRMVTMNSKQNELRCIGMSLSCRISESRTVWAPCLGRP